MLEIIEFYRKRNTTEFVAFLDASKACDRVNNRLLFNLIDKKSISIYCQTIFVLVCKTEMKVRWGNKLSSVMAGSVQNNF